MKATKVPGRAFAHSLLTVTPALCERPPMPDSSVSPETTVNPAETLTPSINETSTIPVNAVNRGGLRRANPELRERCKLLYYQGLRHAAISEQTGVNVNVLRVWATKHGWTKAVNGAKEVMRANGVKALSREVGRELSNASAKLRETLSDALQAQAEAVKACKVVNRMDCISEASDVILKQAQAGKLLHDWGANKPTGLVLGTLLAGADQEEEPIAIAAEVMPCGAGDTISGVPSDTQGPNTPQDTQTAAAEPETPQPN